VAGLGLCLVQATHFSVERPVQPMSEIVAAFMRISSISFVASIRRGIKWSAFRESDWIADGFRIGSPLPVPNLQSLSPVYRFRPGKS
jgi:hypothetical protein